ncbi:MerR family transcriptional regulator [Enterococcus thailandicus]|nr:MerR family transcriptional regulator [Enterococcus thailandicus]
MKTKTVSELTKIPISTLRFYERQQLIPKRYISRDNNNYRVYAEEVVPYLKRLSMLASTGFTIFDLQNLTSDAQNLTKEEQITFTEEKIQEITAMQNDLESAKELLSKMVAESKKNDCVL